MYKSKLANLVISFFIANTLFPLPSSYLFGIKYPTSTFMVLGLMLFVISLIGQRLSGLTRITQQFFVITASLATAYVLAVVSYDAFGSPVFLFMVGFGLLLILIYQIDHDIVRHVWYAALTAIALSVQFGAILGMLTGWYYMIGATFSIGWFYTLFRRDYVRKHQKDNTFWYHTTFVVSIPLFTSVAFFLIAWYGIGKDLVYEDMVIAIPIMFLLMIGLGYHDYKGELKYPSRDRIFRPYYGGWDDDDSGQKNNDHPYYSMRDNEMIDAHRRGEINDFELETQVSMNQIHERREEDE